MGFLDFIGGIIQQGEANFQEAQKQVKHWDARKICRVVEQTPITSFAKLNGYKEVLCSKCRKMSDRELKSVFDEAYDQRNLKACRLMMSVMSDRKLAEYDSNGNIVRKYR